MTYVLRSSHNEWAAGTQVEIISAEKKQVTVYPLCSPETKLDLHVNDLVKLRTRTDFLYAPLREARRAHLKTVYELENK